MKNFKLAKLHKTTTRWYVAYHHIDSHTGKFKRFRQFISSSYVTELQKEKRGKELVAKINQRLRNGWNPSIEKERLKTKSCGV